MTLQPGQRRGIAAALLSAVMFGLTVPVIKGWFATVHPWLLAGLLYLGSGIGLGAWAVLRKRAWSIEGKDLRWLAGAVLAGGIVAPVLLLIGLRGTPASTASLLLTSEGLFTSVLAWVAFREHWDRRIVLGFLAITAGAVVLAVAPGKLQPAHVLPIALVLSACLMWGIDNNLTRKVALGDPVQVAAVKGLVAGLTNTVLALTFGAQLPPTSSLASIGLLGVLGYGLSLALFIYALRELGTARSSAYFSVAPFVGAACAVLLLAEPLSWALIVAGVLMSAGVWLHVTERHAHDHEHPALEHEHVHTHDVHHDHHDDDAQDAPHSHRHVHAAMRHGHPHFPDAHHRHDHSGT